MSQQPRLRLDDPYEKIVELERKLTRANRYIKRLRQENDQLQKQFSWLQGKPTVEPTPLPKDVSILPPNKRRRRRRKPVERYGQVGRVDSARGLSFRRKRRPLLRLVGVAIAGLTILVMVVSSISALVRLVTRRPVSPPPQAALVVPDLLPSPLLPPPFPVQAVSLSAPSPQIDLESIELVYNVATPPDLKPNLNLQAIVDELVNMALEQGLPTEELSITLINVKTNEVAGYQQQELRYPASVLKLFWMVNLYGAIAQGVYPDDAAFQADLFKMVQQSSNDAASQIIDRVTGTKSGDELDDEAYQTWRNQRLKLSEFFQKSGYEGLIVSQKTYPFFGVPKPQGRELQLWEDPQQPVQNRITSDQAARLMYEIVTGKAISPEYSRKMAQWLARDLSPAGKVDEARFGGFNPIEGFFGKSLPADVDFASKAGWTSTSRHEVAFVKTRDGKIAYILVVLGGDRAYSNDWKIFPQMSRLVFERLGGTIRPEETGVTFNRE